MFSLVSFAGMTLDKCAVFQIGMLTGGPCAGRVTPCADFRTYSSLHDLLVGFQPAKPVCTMYAYS